MDYLVGAVLGVIWRASPAKSPIYFPRVIRMHELLLIEEVDQAEAMLKPLRVELLKRMSEPRTCSELAEIFSLSPQSVYYHVKELEKAGLVEKVAEVRVRGTVEGHYQARARAYWLSPQLVGQLGGPRGARDQASLRYLLSLAEELTHRDRAPGNVCRQRRIHSHPGAFSPDPFTGWRATG